MFFHQGDFKFNVLYWMRDIYCPQVKCYIVVRWRTSTQKNRVCNNAEGLVVLKASWARLYSSPFLVRANHNSFTTPGLEVVIIFCRHQTRLPLSILRPQSNLAILSTQRKLHSETTSTHWGDEAVRARFKSHQVEHVVPVSWHGIIEWLKYFSGHNQCRLRKMYSSQNVTFLRWANYDWERL